MFIPLHCCQSHLSALHHCCCHPCQKHKSDWPFGRLRELLSGQARFSPRRLSASTDSFNKSVEPKLHIGGARCQRNTHSLVSADSIQCCMESMCQGLTSQKCLVVRPWHAGPMELDACWTCEGRLQTPPTLSYPLTCNCNPNSPWE